MRCFSSGAVPPVSANAGIEALWGDVLAVVEGLRRLVKACAGDWEWARRTLAAAGGDCLRHGRRERHHGAPGIFSQRALFLIAVRAW